MAKTKKTIGTKNPVYTRERTTMTDAERVDNQPYDIDVIPEPEVPSKVSRLTNYVVVGALILTALSLGILFKWATASEEVLQIKNAPFPVRTIREHTTPNGVVIMNVNFCKTSDVKGTVRTSFISSSREIFLPVRPEPGPKQCLETEVPVVIPKDIPADTYKIKFRVTYDLNPLKKNVINEFESKEFVVETASQ